MQNVTLQEAEQAQQYLTNLQQKADLVPQLKARRDADRFQAEAAQAVSITHATLGDEIKIARGQIALYHTAFMPWVAGDAPPDKSGGALVLWMKEIQAPLVAAFAAHVAAIRAQQGRASNAEQAGRIQAATERAVYASLQGLGAFADDLEPFPTHRPGNQWASDLVQLMAKAVGQPCYHPSAGVGQFRRGSAAR